MKNYFLLILFSVIFCLISCNKAEENDRFELLTTPLWQSDSLLVNGLEAGGQGQILEKFNGTAKFNRDATGYFGQYTGSWRFADDRNQIIITTDSLPIPLTTLIRELTSTSLKITTAYPDQTNPSETMNIRMTFVAK
ncbi:MAG: hypothetical protein H3C41_05020 [Bacteroidales bacterium]|nr:hypothetical protein [Bacteroidales bacterium]